MTARSLTSFRPGAPGLPVGTGAPVMDARADFQRARRAYIAARALRWLPSGEPARPACAHWTASARSPGPGVACA